MGDGPEMISGTPDVFIEGRTLKVIIGIFAFLIVGILLYSLSTQTENSSYDKPVSIREIVASPTVTPIALEALYVIPKIQSRVAYGDINGDAIQDAVAHLQYDHYWLDSDFPTTTPEGKLVVPDPEYLEATTLLFIGMDNGGYKLAKTNISPIDVFAGAEYTGITYDTASSTGTGFVLSYGAGGNRCWNSSLTSIYFEYDPDREDWYPISRELRSGCEADTAFPGSPSDLQIDNEPIPLDLSFSTYRMPPGENLE